MDPRFESALREVFRRVLSEFAFLCAEHVPSSELPVPGGRLLVVRLPFEGSLNGDVGMALPEVLAKEIACNSLGVDGSEESVARSSQDAAKEVVSILGGHLAPVLAGNGGRIELSPPRLELEEERSWEGLRSVPLTLGFLLGEQPVLAWLRLRTQEAAI